MSSILICPFPVGMYIQMASGTNPNEAYAGTTWEKVEGRFLYAADASHALGTTGGAETVTLTVDQIPSHNHSVGAHAHGLNSHTHSVGAHSHGLNSHTHTYAKPNSPTGGTAITTAQLASHSHATDTWGRDDSSSTKVWGFASQYGGCTTHNTKATGSGNSHTHTVGTTSTNSGVASGSTANSTAFNTGAASGNTANSTAFDSGSRGGVQRIRTCRRTSRPTRGFGRRRRRRMSMEKEGI